MSDTPPSLNPYVSPRASSFEGPHGHSEEIFARVLRRRWLVRRLALFGRSDAVIEYNGRGLGHETIRVNGQIAKRVWARWSQTYFTPCLEFQIPVGTRHLNARVEVKTAWLAFLGGFRLVVCEEVVYSEGIW